MPGIRRKASSMVVMPYCLSSARVSTVVDSGERNESSSFFDADDTFLFIIISKSSSILLTSSSSTAYMRSSSGRSDSSSMVIERTFSLVRLGFCACTVAISDMQTIINNIFFINRGV